MPWVFTNDRRGRRRGRAQVNPRTRRAYRNGGADTYADNGGDTHDDRQMADDNESYNDRDNGWDGTLYDRGGDRVRLTIQTPRDMLPPRRRATELPGTDWSTIRSRSRF